MTVKQFTKKYLKVMRFYKSVTLKSLAVLMLAALTLKVMISKKLLVNLSGGERNRVHLAKLVQTGGNVLLLDEPTNDLRC